MWILVAMAFAGWNGVVTEGDVGGDFHTLDVVAACTLTLKKGPTSHITFRYESERETPVLVDIAQGTLTVRGKGAYRDCVIEGTYERISTVRLSNAAQAQVTDLEGQRVSLTLDNAAELEAHSVKSRALDILGAGGSTVMLRDGVSSSTSVTLSGAGTVDISGVESPLSTVAAQGASVVRTHSNRRLVATAMGGSKIVYVGGATDREVKMDQSSTVRGE